MTQTRPSVTLITGGSSGIGAATARRLLDHGHRVAVTGRSRERLDRFASALDKPDGLLTLRGDAGDPEAVQAAVDAAVSEFGRLDNAVANAGYATFDSVVDGDPSKWRDMILT
ncbi:MAG: SDR family oxidoreductase, partial [Stackebrandtia sp.]